ncbi:hypothetical protein [Prochlorococcus sp. MIT 1341]|uniref:hypothetical protein n=1 Tax=Prochlorococcus sp. MIT 1341 TaxID=3096221 RepID=UPI002A75AD30|nr:hypothetical protein [Prochlorococcus sp. MIT 1341]
MRSLRVLITLGLTICNYATIHANEFHNYSIYKYPEDLYKRRKLSSKGGYQLRTDQRENNEIRTRLEAAKFSPTTKINGNLNFVSGAVRNGVKGEAAHSTYEYKLKLSSSITGKDLLITKLEVGNALESSLGLDLQSSRGQELQITSLYYTFPVDKNIRVSVGPKMFGYEGLAGTSSAYNERIAILDGSNYSTDAGNGAAFVISYLSDNGYNSSLKLTSENANNSSEGILTEEGKDSLIYQVGYSAESFGGTVTFNKTDEFDALGLGVYISPEKLPSLSASIELKNQDNGQEIINWLLALNKTNKDSTIGIGFGTYDINENIAYEVWYNYNLTDTIMINPILFVKKEGNSLINKDEFGFGLNARFKF